MMPQTTLVPHHKHHALLWSWGVVSYIQGSLANQTPLSNVLVMMPELMPCMVYIHGHVVVEIAC